MQDLTQNWIPALEAALANGLALTDAQQALYDEIKAMLSRTVNDPTADNALMERFRQMLTELGVLEAPQQKEDRFGDFFNQLLKRGNDLNDRIFGAKGYLD